MRRKGSNPTDQSGATDRSDAADPFGVTPPAARMLGRRIVALDREAGEVELQFVARPEFLNRHGSVQGGLLAAMLDSTVSCAVLGTLERGGSVVTLEMKVSYLRPAPPGVIRARGRLLQRGGTVAFAAGDLFADDDAVLASATATLRILDKKQ